MRLKLRFAFSSNPLAPIDVQPLPPFSPLLGAKLKTVCVCVFNFEETSFCSATFPDLRNALSTLRCDVGLLHLGGCTFQE